MIQLGAPAVGEPEIDAVSEALREGTLSTGEIVTKFESDCAALAGREHAAAVSSGSVALELALQVCDLADGASVVVSPYNCGAVLYSILRAGLQPVFADINSDTYNLDREAVESAIESAEEPVEGLLPVHLYGQPCAMDELAALADQHEIRLIEDFAQAVGASFRGSPTGSWGEIGVASFGATKNLTTAEGGIVVSDDEATIERIKTLRSNTNAPIEGETLLSVRMNDLEAAIGRVQVSKYDEIVERKREVAAIYDDRLPDAVGTPAHKENATHVYHGYPIRTRRRDALSGFLAERDVETAAVYDTPLYDYPHVPAPPDPVSMYSGTERACAEVLLLPIHGSLSTGDARMVAAEVAEFFE